MILNVNIQKNNITKEIIELQDIPCICKIQINGVFEIFFQNPLFEASGHAIDFVSDDLNSRFPVLGGGNIAQHCNALITIKEFCENQYSIISLSFFSRFDGWVKLIDYGEWCLIEKNDYSGY